MPAEKSHLTHLIVRKPEQGQLLRQFLAERLQLSSRKVKTLLDERRVWVNNRRIWMAKHPLSTGDKVEVRGSLASPGTPASTKPIPILHRDNWIVAVNKPAGLLSDRERNSVETRLRTQLNCPELRALHRLDKDTSGVLLFAIASDLRDPYLEIFRKQEITKQYHLLLAGVLPKTRLNVTKRLDGKEATSKFVQRRAAGPHARVSCWIGTGRTHQIRRHLASLDCRLLGDARYQAGPPPSQKEKTVARQMLHAEQVIFTCPHTRSEIIITAPLPSDFQTTAKSFGIS